MILFYIKKMTDKMNSWLKRIDFFCLKFFCFWTTLANCIFEGYYSISQYLFIFHWKVILEGQIKFLNTHMHACTHTHTYIHTILNIEQKTCYHKFLFLFLLLLLYFILFYKYSGFSNMYFFCWYISHKKIIWL